MLQHLNTLIGFAAVFAILSLLVTSVTQVIRGMAKLKTRTLIDRLLRLFGELDDPERFVAAILCHPSLEGAQGKEHYLALTDPRLDHPRMPERGNFASDEEFKGACASATKARSEIDGHIAAVLGRGPGAAWRRRLWPWPSTTDLDKQTVKDIGQSVYEAIGYIVDKPLPPPRAEGPASQRWAWDLKRALDQNDKTRLSALEKAADAGTSALSASPSPQLPSAVAPFRGRMWMLAASAFPEAEGKAPPLKTYVAAFHDEAQASASDAFTWKIRWVTVVVSAVITALLGLDVIAVWNRAAHADTSATAAIVEKARALEGQFGKPGTPLDTKAAAEAIIAKAGEAANSGLLPEPWTDKPGVLGLLLSVAALSLGAPFWFEVLKAAIQMKSAFTSDKKG